MAFGSSGQLRGGIPGLVRAEVDARSLYVKRVHCGSGDELSMAVFGVHAQESYGGNDIRIEDVWNVVKKGQRVKVTIRTGESGNRTLFHGWIVAASVRAGGRMEDLEYTAYGLDWGLAVERLFGSWCANTTGKDGKSGKSTYLRGIPPVFNPDGRPNRHKAMVQDEDADEFQRYAFNLDADPKNESAVPFSAADMVRYVVGCERKASLSKDEKRVFPSVESIGGELAEFFPSDVNVDGESIWSAIVKIAARCSYGVRIRYRDDRSKPELVFFTLKIDDGQTKKQFELPEATLDNVRLQQPDILAAAIDAQFDLAGVVRQVDAIAPRKLYEHQWELLQGWRLEEEEACFGEGTPAQQIGNFLRETNPETSSNWERFRNVGRRYVLNETGRDDTTTPEVGPYDFSSVFKNDPWAVRNRPFRNQRVKVDDVGRPLPIRLHVEWTLRNDYDLGHQFELLHDRAGIYFRSAPLVDVAAGIAADDATAIFPSVVSVDAVVEGDADGPTNVSSKGEGKDLPLPTFAVVRIDDGLRTDNVNDSQPATDAAQRICDEAVKETQDERAVGTVVCPFVTFSFDVGDVVDKINGREIKLKAMVRKVCWDFIEQNTEIALHYPELDTQGHSRTLQGSPPGIGTHGDDDTSGPNRKMAGHQDAGESDPSRSATMSDEMKRMQGLLSKAGPLESGAGSALRDGIVTSP